MSAEVIATLTKIFPDLPADVIESLSHAGKINEYPDKTVLCHEGKREKDPDDWTGGGTFSFEVWRGHPMFGEAVSMLAETRSRARALRERIRDFNARHSIDGERRLRVVFYVGQSLIGQEEVDEEENERD